LAENKLTKVQTETLKLLDLGYSVGMVAAKRKVSTISVYKTIRILERKGFIQTVGYGNGISRTIHKPIRLHALQYQIKIIYSSPVYSRLLKNSNILNFNNFTVRLYDKSLTLWIKESFTYSNADMCKAAAKDFLGKTLRFLERKLSITILKAGYQNIKEVKSHFARLEDETAQKCNKDKSRIVFKDPKDGKAWLITDKSFKGDELETVHSKTAYSDMAEVVEPLYNTLRQDPYILSKIQAVVKEVAKSQLTTQNQILALSKLLTAIFGAGKDKPQDPPESQDTPGYIG